MTTSSNNWMLIKIIKLFGALVPLEPRLGKKLLEPLTNLINSTSAMSLLYECINTVIAVLISISAGGDHTASIQLCVQKLGVLIEDSDQNLKYLGLLAMGKILKTHPKAVQAHKDIVLRCLDDKDESIRLRSLDLLYGMVSKKNIIEIVKKLMEHVEAAEGSHYRDELLSRIIGICSYNNYQYITNFEWYISVLVELTKVEGTKHGAKIAEQIQDVTVRVESIRHFSVSQMALLVENAHVLLAGSAQQRSNMCEVLLAAAWICGEYSQHVRNVQSVLESMLRAKTSIMPGHILSVYVQNIGKLYSSLLTKAEEEEDWDVIESLDNLMLSKLPQFELAEHLEAQERACTLMSIIRIVEAHHQQREKLAHEIAALYEGELNPVAVKAQKKVPIPDGLDLDAWIAQPWESSPEESSEESDVEATFGLPVPRSHIGNGNYMVEEDEEEEEEKKKTKKKGKKKASGDYELTPEESERRRKQRESEIENNPYYVKGTATVPKRPTRFGPTVPPSESVEKLNEIQSPLEIPGVVGLHRYMEQQDSTLSWKKAKEEKKTKKTVKKGKKRGKKRAESTSSEEEMNVVHKVNRADGEMPEGARSTDEDDNLQGVSDEFRALDIDLDAPLRPDEIVRAPQAYTRVYPSQKQGPLVPRPPTTAELSTGYHQPPVITQSETGLKKKTKKKTAKDSEAVTTKKTKKKKEKKETTVAVVAETPFDMDQWLNAPDRFTAGLRAYLVCALHEPGVVSCIIVAEKKGKKKTSKKTREAYEEASGVCTPSNPNAASILGSSPRLSRTSVEEFSRLAANKDLSIDYDPRASTDALEYGRVLVLLRLKNTGKYRLQRVELNIVDTLNAKMLRNDENAVRLCEEIEAGSIRESSIDVQVQSANNSRTLRGTVNYFIVDEEGTQEGKIDFRMALPTTTFIVAPTEGIRKEHYSELLTGDLVDFAATASVPSETPFKKILGAVVAKAHFSVVEETIRAASLFSRTIGGDPICLLIKSTEKGVQIDGKAGEQQLIQSIVQDVAEICARA
ncbi:unnamed protein product [Caenorhabditis auriculariae]|uniref:AP-3 complex subunit delta domain-containing protein n=1 Tax=Caenorhabditis auriculariae TaxID=2777116 RepID=A0A8S1HBN1_9PELO|nr:unnamed protein product [Caenorhabditis auriculariae]